ncbi:NAD(P)H-binding protein [Bradymonas sediminis]|uniref:Epimerase n=1 Tax=Bradymonas sediminis TaxID=1548548 RepID=A0A2Z4FIG0_9DELT|nr:NAD(P)H-binding protein [Bradymonas sediminis]AWV88595.1 epimerase [Bradymonas sediminis]TDP77741.1 putative NAD(P)-binding protein [Bradymonas sediminis]
MTTNASEKSSTPRILVIGATGYTGRAVVAQLAERPATKVWAHIRPDSSALPDWQERVKAWENVELSTAAWEEEAIRAELARLEPTHIFLLLGTTKARGRQGTDSAVADTYEAVDYGLTHMVLEANKATAQPGRVIYLSAIGVKQGTTNPYLKVRARIEAELQAASVSWASVRASFISGPDRGESRPLERIGSVASKPLFAALGALGAKSLSERYQPRTGAELAALLIDCALNPELSGILHLDDIVRG